jgi:hypothetical protein
MKKRFAPLFVFALGLSAQTVSLPAYWKYALPGAQLLAGVDVQAVKASPLLKELGGQALKMHGTGSLSPSALPAFAGLPKDLSGGLGLLDHVQKVFVSVSDSGGLSGKGKAQPKIVAAVYGDFDLAELRAFLKKQGGVKVPLGGLEAWQSGQTKDNVMIAIAGPQVIVVGDKASLREAVTRSSVSSALLDRAKAMSASQHIWAVGAVPPSLFAAAKDNAAGAMMSGLLQQVEGYEFGLKMADGIDLEVNVDAATEEAAKSMQSMLQMGMQMAASQQEDPQVTDLLRRVRLGSEGGQLKLVASWTRPEIEAAIHKATSQAVQMAGKQMPSGAAAQIVPSPSTPGSEPTVTARPVRPAEPLRVKIYNADSGPAEITIH